MSDLKPVKRPSFFLDGLGGRVLTIVAVAILVAVIKPWGTDSTPGPVPSQAMVITPRPSPTPDPTPDPADARSRAYDPLVFGDHELERTWGLWPAGYLTTLGFAMRAEPSPPPSPASGGPSSSPGSSGPPDTPAWPDSISVRNGNHLLLIGVDTPLGFRVDGVRLTRDATDGSGREEVPIVLPPSPWPSHFTVIAVDSGFGLTRVAYWLPGRYHLELVIDPGGIERSIEIVVEGPDSASPGPDGSPSPSL